jgi:sigma-B regulation protein RsbU (phosphoserine phosphatase)
MARLRDTSLPHALLATLPGRALIVGAAAKLVLALLARAIGPLPRVLDIVDTAAGLALALAAIYFAWRIIVWLQRRLLWRVRRKLILSYIFIGFVPAVLIAIFFLLSGLLLFFNFSSYLLQSRLEALGQEVRFVADRTVVDVQRSRGFGAAAALARARAANPQFADLSLAIVPADLHCANGAAAEERTMRPAAAAAGSWSGGAPASLPAWIGCDEATGLFAAGDAGVGASVPLIVRAVALPDVASPGYAVVVELPVDSAVRARLRAETGVEIARITRTSEALTPGAAARLAPDGQPAPAGGGATSGLSWVTFLNARDWQTGTARPLLVATELSVAEVYDLITAAQGMPGNRSAGNVLLILLVVVGGLFLIIQFVALVLGLVLARSITGSVHELFEGTERVRQGDFTHKIAVRANDQLGELASSFNSMTSSIEDLLQQAAEKKRLEEELRIAHEIQMSLLPQGPLAMPGLSVTALCVPAREVGGDYYDFLPLDDHRVGLLIADVSGKGTSAALYMAELKGLVLSLSRIHSSPRDLLIAANRLIAEHLDSRSFITMTYAVVNVRAGTMTYARAGHTPLIYVPGPGAVSRRARILAPDGMVLGLKLDNGEMFERHLVEETLALRPGDLCVLFTDGISEAMNAADDCFGESRLGRLAEEHADLPSDELRERVLREVDAFVGGSPQHDDMTMILLKVDERQAVAVA